MKTKPLVLLLFCLIIRPAISQNTQVYYGKYRLNEIDAIGTAKYSYFETENYQRIYHGDFTLTFKTEYFTGTITGKFKNDLRNGEWIFKYTFYSPPDVSILLNINYLNGQPNGIWTATGIREEKIVEHDKRVFKNGLLIDTWEYYNTELESKLKIKLDKDGVIMESDILQSGENQKVSKFKAGYEILSMVRNVQTGESTVNRVDDKDKLAILTRIEYYSKNFPDSLIYIPYKLEKKSIADEIGNLIDMPYRLTFTKDIKGAIMFDGHQYYGLYVTELIDQEIPEFIRIEAEQKRQTDTMDRPRHPLVNTRNVGLGTRNEGVVSGESNKDLGYNLQGRGFQSLPAPQYDYQGEGRVVVEISVDRLGIVIKAIPGISGSTTLDEYLLKVSMEAALKARFEPKPDAPEIQKGTITYNFVLQ